MTVTDPIDLACTVDDVASWIRARTKDSNGNEVGTFNENTRPTAEQVQEAIDQQVILLHSKVGSIGTRCADLARGVVAIGAAAQVELSYFPEQARTDRSPYTYLKQLYDDRLQGLYDCVAGNLPDCPTGPVPPDDANYRFGTLPAISATVHDFYTGQIWPPLPAPPPVSDDSGGS